MKMILIVILIFFANSVQSQTFDWSEAGQILSKPFVKSVYFSDEKIGWVTGDGGRILKSNDGGYTFSEQESGIEFNLTAIFFIDSLNGWVVGDRKTILNTGNGGKEWTVQFQDINSINTYISDIKFVDKNTGLAVGSYDADNDTTSSKSLLLVTNNGGKNWQEIDLNEDFLYLYKCDYINSNNGYIVGYQDIDSSDSSTIAVLLRTENSGNNWSVYKFPEIPFFYNVDFVNDSTGWAIGSDEIYYTTDSGKTWNIQYEKDVSGLTTIQFINEDIGWAAGHDILNTIDGGENWYIQNDVSTYHIKSLFFLNEMKGWAVGIDNGRRTSYVWRYRELTNIQNNMSNSYKSAKYFLYSNYPNPFNSSTNIPIELITPSIVHLCIYNIKGEKIKELINKNLDAGIYNFLWDGSNNEKQFVSSGVYYCIMKTEDGFVDSKKMIVIK